MATNFPVTAGFMHQFYADNTKAYNYEIFGVRLQQNQLSINFLSRLLEEHRPDTIIEIGTYTGGLSILFGLYGMMRKAEVYTFDIEDKRQSPSLLDKLGVVFVRRDCFAESSDDLIKGLFNGDPKRRSFVFCDGGNKIKEFNYYADLLKSGDIICCHDYARDKQTFDQFVYLRWWGWSEITYADIEEAVKRNGLVPVQRDIAECAALGVFMKP